MKDKTKLRTEKIQVMLTKEEYDKILELADRCGRTVSNYARLLLLYSLKSFEQQSK